MSYVDFLPLGGLGETGSLNCMLYETAGSAVLVDCGMAFGGDDFPGVNLITPDFAVLEPLREKLIALILTHGHEDHGGAVPFLQRQIPLDVYATPFTFGVIKEKLLEHGLDTSRLKKYSHTKTLQLKDFVLHPVFANHSIPDTVGLHLQVQGLNLLHLTDFKIDHDSKHGVTDLKKLKKIGDEGLDLLLLDSTNVFSPGWTASEKEVQENLLKEFQRGKGRLIACLFTSNAYRLQSLIDCARKTNRKIAITGRSARQYTHVARSLDLLKADGVEFYDVEDIHHFADHEIFLIVTGSQAEHRSVLNRMSWDLFKPFRFREGDTLIMSSKMIPGNEGKILEMLNRISLLGVKIVEDKFETPIHTSGHAKDEELREIMRLTRPKYFVPIHGEARHLKRHAEIAEEEGIENITVIFNGDRLRLSKEGLKRIDHQEIRRRYWHDSLVEMTEEAISNRRKMAWNGLVVASLVFDSREKKILSDFKIQIHGIFGGDIELKLTQDLSEKLRGTVTGDLQTSLEDLSSQVRSLARRFFKDRFGFKPEVVVLVNKI